MHVSATALPGKPSVMATLPSLEQRPQLTIDGLNARPLAPLNSNYGAVSRGRSDVQNDMSGDVAGGKDDCRTGGADIAFIDLSAGTSDQLLDGYKVVLDEKLEGRWWQLTGL